MARHRHGRPGLFDVAVLMATWPPLRPLRRRWFGRRTVSRIRPVGVVVPMPAGAVPVSVGSVLSHRAA